MFFRHMNTQGTSFVPGRHFRLAPLVPGGVNFSIYSANATSCTLVLFDKGARA